jgi:hypothetical protein
MLRKVTSAEDVKPRLNTLPVFLIIITFIFPLLLTSCELYENLVEVPAHNEEGEETTEETSYGEDLSLFDCSNIELDITGAIGIEIKNCNVYADIYEDLIILGEIENISDVNKTDIRFTFDFYDKRDEVIMSEEIPALANYLGAGKRLPFHYYMSEREKFIEISRIKVGVNYKDYNRRFEGNPVVEEEKHYFTDDGSYLVTEGRVINIGESKIKNLEVFCTFYNSREQVAFIRKCYILREEMIPGEEQEFKLEVMLDEYLPEFTHYRFEAFFEDEAKTAA